MGLNNINVRQHVATTTRLGQIEFIENLTFYRLALNVAGQIFGLCCGRTHFLFACFYFAREISILVGDDGSAGETFNWDYHCLWGCGMGRERGLFYCCV